MWLKWLRLFSLWSFCQNCILGIKNSCKWQCLEPAMKDPAVKNGVPASVSGWEVLGETDAWPSLSKTAGGGGDCEKGTCLSEDTDFSEEQSSCLALLQPVQSNGTVGLTCVHNLSQCHDWFLLSSPLLFSQAQKISFFFSQRDRVSLTSRW